ncbi:hypothetical protein [Jannaschia donghaensis]|uniref:hypothetical protein n=1 Tax=Jannaschia donghaensis TaxID=420998 RepID=UPI0011874FC2|nr:hypothetical protein [Jannaschia donghaensis]
MTALVVSVGTVAVAQVAVPAEDALVTDRMARVIEYSRDLDHMQARFFDPFLQLSASSAGIEIASIPKLIQADRARKLATWMTGYAALDLDWNGSLTREEIARRHRSDDEETDAQMATLDDDGDGSVSLDELHDAAATGVILTGEDLITDLAHWDLDGNGFVSRPEFRAVVDAELTRQNEASR